MRLPSVSAFGPLAASQTAASFIDSPPAEESSCISVSSADSLPGMLHFFGSFGEGAGGILLCFDIFYVQLLVSTIARR